jgi:hypothetical protein
MSTGNGFTGFCKGKELRGTKQDLTKTTWFLRVLPKISGGDMQAKNVRVD